MIIITSHRAATNLLKSAFFSAKISLWTAYPWSTGYRIKNLL